MLAKGIESKMSAMALTEHVPRCNKDLYDEEIAEGTDEVELTRRFDAYVVEALRLRDSETVKASTMEVLVGFESDWIDAEKDTAQIKHLHEKHNGVFDFFIGSVHHVAGESIDFSKARYDMARYRCGGTDEGLFEAYFDAQYDMLKALKPKIVGHFDLIRLLSDRPNIDLKRDTTGGEHGKVWNGVIRNLELVRSYGGVLECNSSGLRKGLKEPYPAKAICETWNSMEGLLVLCDDSHAVEQVGICYRQAVDFLKSCGIKELAFFGKEGAETKLRKKPMSEVERMPFWISANSSTN